MTRSEAIAAIRSSVARGSTTPTLGIGDRDAYIQQKARELAEAVVDPVAATVNGVAFEHGLLGLLKSNVPFVVARRGDQWLCFVPSLGEFFLAYGPSPEKLNALGFHSDDALAEWLG